MGTMRTLEIHCYLSNASKNIKISNQIYPYMLYKLHRCVTPSLPPKPNFLVCACVNEILHSKVFVYKKKKTKKKIPPPPKYISIYILYLRCYSHLSALNFRTCLPLVMLGVD